MPDPAEVLNKIKLRSGSSVSTEKTVQPNLDKLIKSVIDRLDKLENSLQTIIAVQLKEAISLINSKIENLDTNIDNMEAKLNQR